MAPKRIHTDDFVKIINPQFVERVGYPLCVNDMVPAAEKALVEAELLRPKSLSSSTVDGNRTRDEARLVREYARFLLGKAKWGGSERKIIFKSMPEQAGRVYRVQEKTVVKTGTRYGPSLTRGSWENLDWDYEPGGLADCKTHVLLNLACGSKFNFGLGRRSIDWSDGFWIPAAHVEKVADASDITGY